MHIAMWKGRGRGEGNKKATKIFATMVGEVG